MQNNLVKSPEEVTKIRKAAEIIDDVYDCLTAEVATGVTEKSLAEFIQNKVLSLGGSGVSFDTIVAFGENGCEPHHVPTDKRLEQGMLVTVDMGAVVDGYCSDFTRTFAYGTVTDEQIKIYEIVLEAYKLGVSAVSPDISCKSVDALCREYISLCGYGDNFIHGTGHGVGTLIHEPPTLNSRSDETLKAGEVVTVEPGIYISEKCGVRIEDMVLVGEGKPFSRHPVELMTITPRQH